MSVNDAIKDMLYGHEHRWRVAEHELAQARADLDTARAEAAALRAEVEAMREVVDEARAVLADHNRSMIHLDDAMRALDALRTRKGGG